MVKLIDGQVGRGLGRGERRRSCRVIVFPANTSVDTVDSVDAVDVVCGGGGGGGDGLGPNSSGRGSRTTVDANQGHLETAFGGGRGQRRRRGRGGEAAWPAGQVVFQHYHDVGGQVGGE